MAIATPEPGATKIEMRPQPKQEPFLQTTADIAIYGGAAGGGKSFGLLLADAMPGCYDNPLYQAITFRRTYSEIMDQGGLWDTARQIYPGLGGKPNESKHIWRFPSGAVSAFRHLEYEETKYSMRGSQLPRMRFDELDTFSESTFFYLFSRNRSPHGMHATIRATVNANSQSWVAAFIGWWWDPETGWPIRSRAGKVRFFVRDMVTGELQWADNPKDLDWQTVEMDGQLIKQPPKSVTFFPAKVTDNKKLLEADPGYLSSLLALAPLERMQLLEGNWLAAPAEGTYFKRAWMPIKSEPPVRAARVRHWDFAATEPKKLVGTSLTRKQRMDDPDWTVGLLLARTPDGEWVIEDVVRFRGSPGEVKATVIQTAIADGRGVAVNLEQEPGSSGKMVVADFKRELAGWNVSSVRPTGSKEERAKPVSAQAEAGNVSLVAGPWNSAFLAEAEMFATKQSVHDDQIDALSGAFHYLTTSGQRGPSIGPGVKKEGGGGLNIMGR